MWIIAYKTNRGAKMTRSKDNVLRRDKTKRNKLGYYPLQNYLFLSQRSAKDDVMPLSITNRKKPWVLVHKRTIPTDRTPLVGKF
jgi:hypothetical protein